MSEKGNGEKFEETRCAWCVVHVRARLDAVGPVRMKDGDDNENRNASDLSHRMLACVVG
jgi:hypothetical protein